MDLIHRLLNELTAIKENAALSPEERAELSKVALEGSKWQELDAIDDEAADIHATKEAEIVVDRRMAGNNEQADVEATRRPDLFM